MSERAPFEQIISDASLVLVAGSDTTATALDNILYELLRNPESYSRLRAEVDGYFPPDEHAHPFVDSTKLAEMPFLNAVMYAPSIQAYIGSTDAWP